MQSKRKHIKDLFTASIRVFTTSLIIIVTWFSHFWGEQKSSLNNPNIYIYGVSVLNSDYYIQYLTSSFDEKIVHFTVGKDRVYDLHLAAYDCQASIAHAQMLCQIGKHFYSRKADLQSDKGSYWILKI